MRSQTLKIAQLVHGIDRDSSESQFIEPLFGPREEGSRNPDFKPHGSRLRVSEQQIVGGNDRHAQRIAIDRFTQGVIPHALFDEQTHAGGTVSIRFEIRNPKSGEAGLLLLAIKDLISGRLPVGGSSSVGRGYLYGNELRFSGNNISEPVVISLDAEQVRQGTIPMNDHLNQLVKEFTSVKLQSPETKGKA